MCGLKSCGNSLEISTREVYHQFYTMIVRMLRDPNTPITLALVAVDALSVNWNNNEDYDMLLKTLTILHNLASGEFICSIHRFNFI
jgi:hypothetical protein